MPNIFNPIKICIDSHAANAAPAEDENVLFWWYNQYSGWWRKVVLNLVLWARLIDRLQRPGAPQIVAPFTGST